MKFPLNLFASFLHNRGDFFRDIVTIVTGSAFSRVLAFLSLPILSRLFTPEEFGVLALFSLIAVTVACIASGRYEVAIVLPDSDSDALHLALIAIVIAAITSLFSLAMVLLWSEQILAAFNADSLGGWLQLVPAYIFIISASSVVSYWATRKKLFGYISVGEVAGTGIKVSTQIGLQLGLGLGSGSLILGQFTYQLTNIAVQMFGALRGPRTAPVGTLSLRRAIELIKRYKKFPQFEASANFLSVSSREFPVLVLGLFFPLDVVGLYSISYRIMSMPSFVVGLSIMRVFYPLAKESLVKGNLDKLSRMLFKQMLILGVTPALLFLVAAPEVMEFILGSKWVNTGIYIQWLTIFMLSHFLILPLLKIFLVYEKQRSRLIYQMVLTVVRLAGLIAGGLLASPLLSVAYASTAGAAVNFVAIIVLLCYTGVKAWDSLGLVFFELLKALPFVAALLIFKNIYPDQLLVAIFFSALALIFGVIRYRSLILIKSRIA
jgi:lipopolysaccharide exporter